MILYEVNRKEEEMLCSNVHRELFSVKTVTNLLVSVLL
jgi:hypothetical protein